MIRKHFWSLALGVGGAALLATPSNPLVAATVAGNLLTGLAGNLLHEAFVGDEERLLAAVFHRDPGIDENHHILLALRQAHLRAIERVLSVFDDARSSDPDRARQAAAERFSRETKRFLKEAGLGKKTSIGAATGIERSLFAAMPEAFETALAARGSRPPESAVEEAKRARQEIEDAVLSQLLAETATLEPELPPSFRIAFAGEPRDGWFDFFVRDGAARLKANPSFNSIWTAEQIARIRHQTDTVVEKLSEFERAADRRHREATEARQKSEARIEAIVEAALNARGSDTLAITNLQAELDAERKKNRVRIQRLLLDMTSNDTADRLHGVNELRDIAENARRGMHLMPDIKSGERKHSNLDEDELRYIGAYTQLMQNMDDVMTATSEMLDTEGDNYYERDLAINCAIEIIGYIGCQAASAVPSLIRFLNDETQNFQYSASRALGGIGTVESIQALIDKSYEEATLPPPPRGMRFGDCGLGCMLRLNASHDVIRVLISGLKTPDYQAQGTILYTLSEIGPAAKDAVPALVAFLDDESDGRVQVAASALWAIGDVPSSASRSLLRAVGSKDVNTRKYAFRALGRIVPVTQDILSVIATGCEDASFVARGGAQDALVCVATNNMEAMLGLLKDQRPLVREQASFALKRASDRISAFRSGSTAARGEQDGN